MRDGKSKITEVLSLMQDTGACDIRDHLPLLYCLASQSIGPIVELGTRNGYSTLALLLGAKIETIFVSVDILPECENLVKETAKKHKLSHLIARPRWFWCGDSVDAAEQWRKTMMQHVGMVFLDADHNYDSVKRDLAAWQPLLGGRRGLLCGHDFALESGGVKQAVIEFSVEHPEYDLMTCNNCFGFFVLTPRDV